MHHKMRVSRLWRFTPAFGPEWGSGGVFGLRYHRGVLYFNLAFEARAHFFRGDEVKTYDYDLVGPGPTSGGDTYNAVAAVDDRIYFGGWVHAPAVLPEEGKPLSFRNKFSHVHAYDLNDDKVSLIWKEGVGHEIEWAGEVSEIIHNGLEDELLIARGDGHRNLGTYRLSLSDNRVERVSETSGLHGTIFMDHAAFNTGGIFMDGMQLVSLRTHKVGDVKLDLSGSISRDGGPTSYTSVGSLASGFGSLFAFTRGGIFVGDPLSESEESGVSFVRLFDFPGYQASPFRVNSLPVGGGILTAINGLPDMLGLGQPRVAMPSVLVYVAPPSVRIVATLGCRITSLEGSSSGLLVGANTMPNLSEYNTTGLDIGHRDILELSHDWASGRSSPLEIAMRASDLNTSCWGGIPLTGYRRADMVVRAAESNRLFILEYDLSLPASPPAKPESVKIVPGKNVIDLSAFSGIVSFRFDDADPSAAIRVTLS